MNIDVKKIGQSLAVASVLCLATVNVQAQQVSVTNYLLEIINTAVSETKRELAEEIATSFEQAMVLQQRQQQAGSEYTQDLADKSHGQPSSVDPIDPQS